MQDPYHPPRSDNIAAARPRRKNVVHRGVYALRWYLIALAPAVLFGALAYFHAYRAARMTEQGNLLLSPDQILASADLLLVSGIVISACMLMMVALNDLVSLAARLLRKFTG